MKQSKFLFILPIMLISLASCKKSFLEVEDNTALIRDQYIKDIRTAQEYLNGMYVIFAKEINVYSTGLYPELVADNMKVNPELAFLMVLHYNWDQVTTQGVDGNMNDLWRMGYQLIRSSSYLIDRAGSLNTENAERAKQMQGEAYGIRALVHFILINVFAQPYTLTANGSHPGIPYITSSDWTDSYKRNTVAEVYTGMINDLDAAISLLPTSNNNTLVMNRNAAKALLARVYLFKEDWQKAKSTAIEIANAVPLMAGNDYPSKLFTLQETEALFQVAPASKDLTPSAYDTYFPGMLLRLYPFLFATKEIADLLTINPDDKRKSWITSGGIGLDTIHKFPINVLPGFGGDESTLARSYYPTIVRSSEMYLTVAEASARLQDDGTARTYLDAIRRRADPTASNSTASGAALLEAIYLERRKELAFEGFRMFDLLRWKKGVNRTDASIGAPASLPYPSEKAIAPIPAVDAAHGMPQNPGY